MAILALALGPAIGQAAPSGPTAGFKDWLVACDNVRTCTAVGFAENAAVESGPHLFITRGGGGADRPEVEIGLGYSDAVEALTDGERIEIGIDGPRALRFALTIQRDEESYQGPVAVFPAERTEAFLAALTQGSRMTVYKGDAVLGSASLNGSSAALRWIDDRQKRAGTVTALVARGGAPASAVPAPPALPAVRLGPRLNQADLPKAPRALLERADVRECADNYEPDEVPAPHAVRLNATEYLWQIPCGAGAYNFNSLFVIARADGTGARGPGFDIDETDHLINAEYDANTRILSSFYKGRGLGDCGVEANFAWDGRAFQPVLIRQMDECLGVTAEHWPVVWRARTSG